MYIRVSTAEQKIHGLSLETQQANLEEWAKREKVAVVGVYADPGISARKKASKRPGLQQMLSDVKAGKIDMIVFTKLDRWFRNVGEYYKVQEVLEQHHVDWKTVLEDYDTSTAAGRLKINIMLSVAQDEADRTSERIKTVFEGKRERREALTGNAPTGYRLEGKKLVKDETSAPAVEAFFRKYLSSGSISEAQQHILDEYHFRIEYQLASKMLDSTAYYGYYYGVDDMCPPYITKEEFDRIQRMRSRPVRKSKENRTYLFSGLITCAECGFRMGGRTNTRSSVPFYNCPGCYIKKACGNHTNLSERKIEAYLLAAVDGKFQEYKDNFSNLQAHRKEKDHQSEIASIRSKISKLKDLYLNDLISLDEYKADQKAMTARIEHLIEQSAPLQQPDFGKIEALLAEHWQDKYSALDRTSRRDFWRVLIKEIRIYPDRSIDYDLDL